MDNVERVPAAPTVPAVPTEPPHAPPAAPAAPAHSAQPVESDAEAEETMPAERVAELRERIRDGGYDAPEAVDEVARRILAAGDA